MGIENREGGDEGFLSGLREEHGFGTETMENPGELRRQIEETERMLAEKDNLSDGAREKMTELVERRKKDLEKMEGKEEA